MLGGDSRSQSVLNALSLIDTDLVLIHDGARPYISHDIIYRIIEETRQKDSAVPSVPVSESISENGVPKNRTNYKLSQTPQGFKTAMLKKAFAACDPSQHTDDALYLLILTAK